MRISKLQNENSGDSPPESLKKRGQARELIASLIKSVPQGTHLTAQEVFQMARDTGFDLSLSTVYRTLGQLKASGEVSSVSGDHGIRYESHDQDHDHDHLICLECGYTIEFVDDLLNGFGQVLARKNGYEFKRSRFDLYGICENCQAKSEEYKVRQAVAALASVDGQIDRAGELAAAALSHFDGRKVERAVESLDLLLEQLQSAADNVSAVVLRFKHKPDDAAD